MGNEHAGVVPEPAPNENDQWAIMAGRDITAPVVIGSHNVAFTAEEGAVVFLPPGPAPDPVRRKNVDSRPRQRHEPMVGRATLIRELRAAVQASRPVQLHGPAGAGKSTILRQAARALPPGRDGVVFLSAISTEVRDVAQQLFEACYETSSYAPNIAELKNLLIGIRVTAYVDNADFSGEQLSELMDMAPDSAFVFASREPTLRGHGTVIEVPGLDVAEGLDLLARESGRPIAEADRAAAIELWKMAQGRPLLLVQAAGLTRSGPSGEAVLPRPSAVTEITRLLLDTIDEAGQAILRLLATLDGTQIAAEHVGALTGTANPRRACAALAGLGLLVPDEDLYSCPPEVMSAIREALNRHLEPFPADQLCRHFATWACSKTTSPDQVARHAAAIAQAARLAQEAGHPELAVRVARAASPSMARALRFGPWGLLLGQGWSAARACGDKAAEAYFTYAEGVRARLTGKVVGATLIGAALGMLTELGELHHATLPPAIAAQPLPALPVASPVPPLQAPPVSLAPPASTMPPTTGIPGPGGPPMTPLSHGAVSHASAAHTTTVANHMAGLTSPPAWVSPQPPVHLPAPLPPAAPPLPPSVPAPPPPASLPPVPPAPVPALTNGIGPVLAKVLTLVAVLAGVAGVRFAVAHAFSAASDPPPTGLAGTWQDPTGGTFTITANGDGTYSFHTPCTTVTLAGSGDTYTGQQTLYDASNPGACIQIGYVTDTFTLDPGGQQIEAVKTVPPGEKDPNGNPIGNCDDCGTSTLTRAPSS